MNETETEKRTPGWYWALFIILFLVGNLWVNGYLPF